MGPTPLDESRPRPEPEPEPSASRRSGSAGDPKAGSVGEAAASAKTRSSVAPRQPRRLAVNAPWMRLAGSGIELAGSTLLLGALGYWMDSVWGTERPYLAAVGVLVGFSLGMYRLIVLAARQQRRDEE